jgi:hypothetical protein
MLLWWGYATVVASGFGLAAWASERIAWRRGRPTRGIWALALLASAVTPFVAWMWPSSTLPFVSAPGGTIGPTAFLRDALAVIRGQSSVLEAWLPWVWSAASTALLASAALSLRSMHIATRRAGITQIVGVPVYVGLDDGPAVFGLLRPRIVMPVWIVGAPSRARRLALVHELNHLRAGDLPLVWSGFILACAMPWNVAAWWLFRRLRQALEVDCDRRVLRRHGDARAYGELLVRTATARSPLLVPGLSTRRSLLRRRIERLAPAGDTRYGARPLLSLLATACVVVAVTLPAPAQRGVVRVEEIGTANAEEPAAGQPATGVYWAREVPPGAGGVARLRELPPGETAGFEAGAHWRFESRGEDVADPGGQAPGPGGRLMRASPKR